MPGLEKIEYSPAFKNFPPTLTSSLNEILVLALAPVLHIFPKGTSSPIIILSLIAGLE